MGGDRCTGAWNSRSEATLNAIAFRQLQGFSRRNRRPATREPEPPSGSICCIPFASAPKTERFLLLQLCILPVLFSLRAQLAHLFPFTFSGLVIIWNRVRGGAERGTAGRSLYPNKRFKIAENARQRMCIRAHVLAVRRSARSPLAADTKFTVKAIRGERVLFSSSRFRARSPSGDRVYCLSSSLANNMQTHASLACALRCDDDDDNDTYQFMHRNSVRNNVRSPVQLLCGCSAQRAPCGHE